MDRQFRYNLPSIEVVSTEQHLCTCDYMVPELYLINTIDRFSTAHTYNHYNSQHTMDGE